jgi:single-strand DNA-binding protein
MLIGHVGSEPRVETTRTGRRVATFSLATNRPAREVPRPTDWHTVVAWDGLAGEVERGVHKGDRVYVEGRIETRVVESARGKRSITEIVAENVITVGSPTEERASESRSMPGKTWRELADQLRTEAADPTDEEE